MKWDDHATPIPDDHIMHLVSYDAQNNYLEGQQLSMLTACGLNIAPKPPFREKDTILCTPCYDKACPGCMDRVWVTRLGQWVSTRKTVNMICETCGKDYSNEPKV